MRRHLASLFVIPLLFCGCRAIYIDHRPDGTTRVYAASILTSPAVGEVKWVTPQTTVSMTGYQSASNVTGADIATFIAAAAKIFLAIP